MEMLLLLLVLLPGSLAVPEDLTGKAFSFPYSSSFGSVNITSDQRNSLKNFTLCFQYQPSAGSINPLFSLYPTNGSCSFSLSKNYDRQYRLYVCGNTLSFCCSSVFQDFPGWVRVCVTWDSRTRVAQLWENGKGSVRKGLESRPISLSEEGTPNVVLNSGSSPFQISDINLWDRELPPWEIMAHGTGNVLSWESVWYTTRGATLLESKR
ncbi:serum amyloid P-component-like [Acipenser ruthenus]|uniref:serum amyloid P-component-like n=1 Tax=Acipenser ruthenus TaxID=7906 RepID=UPI0027411034|nr:serum amyloid P-component-like [Acipenser ruthenus]